MFTLFILKSIIQISPEILKFFHYAGWLKIDSAILPHGQPTTPNESSKSVEVDNTLEEEFVEEDVDIEAEINSKKGFAPAVSSSPSNEILNPGQIPSEPT